MSDDSDDKVVKFRIPEKKPVQLSARKKDDFVTLAAEDWARAEKALTAAADVIEGQQNLLTESLTRESAYLHVIVRLKKAVRGAVFVFWVETLAIIVLAVALLIR